MPELEACEDYDSYYTETNLTIPDFINQRLDEIVSEFASYRSNGRFLDVGFGAGTLLEAARRAELGNLRVEVAESAVEHVRSLGFDVFCGTLQAPLIPRITLTLSQQAKCWSTFLIRNVYLKEIARVLRPGGLLWITTPHARGVSSLPAGVVMEHRKPPEHLQLFSVLGIKKMLDAKRISLPGARDRECKSLRVDYKVFETIRAGSEGGKTRAHDRVRGGITWNEGLMASPWRRLVKSAINNMLDLSRLGDSLKIWAEK